jgi:acid phosphatase (class A)
MYPSIATNASSPSYPSGHSIDSLVIGHVLSKLYPAHKNEIMQTAYQISLSRYISGIHFSFDMIFGETIG